VSQELDVANAFYFGMLENEIRAAGQPEAVPLLRSHARLRLLAERVVAGEREPHIALTLAVAHRLTDLDIRVDGESGELVSWYLGFLAPHGDESMTAEEAIGVATRTANPPPDTKLEHAAYETMGGRTIFRARWSHEYEGMTVEDDFIEVLVNGKARLPFAMTWRYRTPKLATGPRP